MDKEVFFNINEFKKWMKDYPEDGSPSMRSKYAGIRVVAKASVDKMINHVETEEDDYEVLEDFVENGGIIVEDDGGRFLVEVETGRFMLPKKYVARA